VTLVIAHRCNTLERVEEAIALGVDMVEFDVRRTRAGELVAHHDPLFGRTRAQLGDPPLVSEIVELVDGRVPLDVELKEGGYVEEVLRLVRGTGEPIVKSFIDAVVAQAREPGIRTALLLGIGRPRNPVRTRTSELFPIGRARACGADFVAPEVRLARLSVLRRAASAGFPTLVWTVNDDVRIGALLDDERVAGVITDVPARALQLRDV
jgi:glycerophosphoryl diester phosphodiesterase